MILRNIATHSLRGPAKQVIEMAKLIKKTTGLTGLAVETNPHETLKVAFGKLLEVLHRMPPDAAYRKHTERIVRDRLNIVNTEASIQKLEEKINCGQIEEVILQAERERDLAKKMLMWKPWEPAIGEVPKNQWKWPI